LEGGKWKCIIHTCETKTSSDEDSCLTERWELEYKEKRSGDDTILVPEFRIVDATTLRHRVYVVEENSGIHESIEEDESRLIVMVKPRSQWQSYFSHR
jgi:hypothetical protein